MTENVIARRNVFWDFDQPRGSVGNQYICGPVARIVSRHQPGTIDLEELQCSLVRRLAGSVASSQVVDHRTVMRLRPSIPLD